MTDVVALVLDPVSGLQRALRDGERLVDSGGTGIDVPLEDVLNAGNSAAGIRITNLGAPTSNLDAATKKYVDDLVAANNDLDEILSNGNDGGAQQIKNIADPTDAQDAATKAYVDSFATPPGTGDGQLSYWDEVAQTWLPTTDLAWEEDYQLFLIGDNVAPAGTSSVSSSSPYASALFAADIPANRVIMNGDVQIDGFRFTQDGYVLFDTTPVEPSTHIEGALFWDDSEGTLALMTDVIGTTIQVGQETLVRCYNQSGGVLANGTPVYVNGTFSGRPTVMPADADDIDSRQTIGLVTSSGGINNNDFGYVTVSGVVRDVDTSSWSGGDELYVSQTSGQLTNVEPVPPAFAVLVGYALDSQVDGSILVSINAGAVDSAVTMGSGDGQMLYWDEAGAHYLPTTDIAWEQDTQLLLVGDGVAPGGGSSISSSSPFSGAVFAVDVPGETVFVNGKLTVSGLIDPTGLQFDRVASNPGNADTLWVDSATGRLKFGSTLLDIAEGTGDGQLAYWDEAIMSLHFTTGLAWEEDSKLFLIGDNVAPAGTSAVSSSSPFAGAIFAVDVEGELVYVNGNPVAVDRDRLLYVGEHGFDSNTGLTPSAAFRTISAAFTAASALSPTAASPVVVHVVDAGVYEETITGVAHVHLYAPAATINVASTTGGCQIKDGERWVLGKLSRQHTGIELSDGGDAIVEVKEGGTHGTVVNGQYLFRVNGAGGASGGRLTVKLDKFSGNCGIIGLNTNGAACYCEADFGCIETSSDATVDWYDYYVESANPQDAHLVLTLQRHVRNEADRAMMRSAGSGGSAEAEVFANELYSAGTLFNCVNSAGADINAFVNRANAAELYDMDSSGGEMNLRINHVDGTATRTKSNGSVNLWIDDEIASDSSLTLSATTASTSDTTGALIVSGGAGIAGRAHVGDTTVASSPQFAGAFSVEGGVRIGYALGDTDTALIITATGGDFSIGGLPDVYATMSQFRYGGSGTRGAALIGYAAAEHGVGGKNDEAIGVLGISRLVETNECVKALIGGDFECAHNAANRPQDGQVIGARTRVNLDNFRDGQSAGETGFVRGFYANMDVQTAEVLDAASSRTVFGTDVALVARTGGASNEWTAAYGGRFDASAAGSGTTDTVYGIYATATGGTTNWAGYFDGDVYIAGSIITAGLGTGDAQMFYWDEVSQQLQPATDIAWEEDTRIFLIGDNVAPASGSSVSSSSPFSSAVFAVDVSAEEVFVNGKLTVSGLIDPTGLQLTPVAANPGNNNTVWLNSGESNAWTMHTPLRVHGDIRNDNGTGARVYSDGLIAISDNSAGSGLIRSERTGGFSGYVQSEHSSGRHGWNFDGAAFIGDVGGNLRMSTASNGSAQSIEMDGSTGDLRIYSTTQSTSDTTGALVVSGGVGIGDDVYIGTSPDQVILEASGSIHVADGTDNSTDAGVHIDAGGQNGAGTTGGIAFVQQNTSDRKLFFTGNDSGYTFNFGSYSSSSGLFQLSSGQVAVGAELRLGVPGERIMRNGDQHMSLVMNANSDPGAFTAAADTDGYDTYIYSQSGGAHTANNPRGGDVLVTPGVAGSGGSGRDGLFQVNGNAYVTGKLTVDGLIDPTGLELTPVAANPGGTAANTLWLDSGDGNRLKFSGGVRFTDTTASSSTSTGALVVSGGVGIAEALNVGDTFTLAGNTLSVSSTNGSDWVFSDKIDLNNELDVLNAATFQSTIEANTHIHFSEFAGPATPSSGASIYATSDDVALIMHDGGQIYTLSGAHLGAYLSATGAVTVTTAGTYYNLFNGCTLAASTDLAPVNFTVDDTNKRFTYDGSDTSYFKVRAAISYASGNNGTVTIRLAKNGTGLSESAITRTISGTAIGNIGIEWQVSLASSDYIEFEVTHTSNGATVTPSAATICIEPV